MDTENVSRRTVLGALGTTGALSLAGCSSGDDGDGGGSVGGSFTIGMMQDFSGPLPQYGEQGVSGFYSGLAYKADDDPLGSDALDAGDYQYTVGDIEVELLVRDTQFDASTAQTLAEDLVAEDEVDLLYGIANSGGATRVINQVVDRTEVPFIAGPAASAEITAGEETCRERVFRANENTAMDARSGGFHIAENTDVENVALFGADYSFGKSVVQNYKEVLESRGVNIVMERFVQRGQEEWTGLLEEAENNGAEGLVGGFTAQTLIPFATTFLSGDFDLQVFGGFATRVTLGAVGGVLADVLGEDFTTEGLQSANFGPFTTRYHWNQYDNDINSAFVDMHTSAYDIYPDLFTSGAFTAASSIIQAFEQEGEVSADAVVSQLPGMTVADTPKGEDGYHYQDYNHQARSTMTVAQSEVTPSDEEFWPAAIMPGEPIETISGEEVTIPADEMTCDLT